MTVKNSTMSATRVLSFDVGTKNLAVCDMTVKASGSFSVHMWAVTSCVARGVNVNKTPVHELAPVFYNYVRTHVKSWTHDADGQPKNIARVFIENQPLGGRGAARNLKTKILSHILQCVLLEAAPNVPVNFIHPSLKLKDMAKPAEGRSTYRENKLYAIHKTTEYVQSAACENPDECKTLYVDKKMKKDDLADAFLQGLLAGGMHARGDVIAPPSDEKKKKVKKATDAAEGPAAAGAAAAPKKPRAVAPKKVAAAAVAAEAIDVPVAAAVEPVAQKPKAPRKKRTADEIEV